MTDATYLKARRTASSLRVEGNVGRLTGRTKGGMNTKRHAVTDANGRPLSFFMTAGLVSDYTGAAALLDELPKAQWLPADRGYDAYPHAADLVFGADCHMTAVDLDVTLSCILSHETASRLVKRGGEAARFFWDISRNYEKLYRDHDGIDGRCIHDVAAAVWQVRPDLFTAREGPIRVVAEGIAIGEAIQKPAWQVFPPSAWDSAPAQTACMSADADQVVEIYAQAILGLSSRS